MIMYFFLCSLIVTIILYFFMRSMSIYEDIKAKKAKISKKEKKVNTNEKE